MFSFFALRAIETDCFALLNCGSYLVASYQWRPGDHSKDYRYARSKYDRLGRRKRRCRGLGARRQLSAAVSYVLKYRVFDGRQRWHTIGRHGAPWTPDMARAEARRVLGEVVKGGDPSAERQKIGLNARAGGLEAPRFPEWKLHECVSETVRVGVGQASSRKGVLEDTPDRGGANPMLTRQPNGDESLIRAYGNFRCGKKRIVIAVTTDSHYLYGPFICMRHNTH
jgi:hypothetical protein